MSSERQLRDAFLATASQLSPRRTQDTGTATTALPFYDKIAPTNALEQLFEWFHPKKVAAARDKDGMTLDEFNQLRRCLGHPVVSQEQWTAALAELHHEPNDVWVRSSEFNELFGLEPFFGIHADPHAPVHLSIMQQVAAMEEFVHFLKMLFEKFSTDGGQTITLAAIQKMQKKACQPKVDDRTWERLCHQLDARHGLEWIQFGYAWHTNLNANPSQQAQYLFTAPNNKPMHPTEVVQTILAEEKLTSHFASNNLVSRQALHGLLKVSSKQKQLADTEWCAILEENQKAYPSTDQRTATRAKEAVQGTPHDIIVHNANNIMMYEIAFDEPGALGVQLQSDYFGQCMSVHSVEGQALKHPTIQKDDIVAAIDGQLTIYNPLDSHDGEQERLAQVQSMMDVHDTSIRKVVFVRQEVYFHIDDGQMRVTFRVYEPIQVGGSLSVQLPPSVSVVGENVTVEFEQDMQDLLRPTHTFSAETKTINVVLTGAKGIKQDAFVTLLVGGISSSLHAGPGYVLHEDDTNKITLFNDWNMWRELVVETFCRPKTEQPHAPKTYDDPSLRPLSVEIARGDCGITFESDFFGCCVVVSELSPIKELSTLAKEDILSSIEFQNDQGTLERVNAIKPFANSDVSSHFQLMKSTLATRANSGTPYTLRFLRLQSHYVQVDDRTTLTFNALQTLPPDSKLVIEMPTADWKAADVELIQVQILKPDSARIGRTHWDASAHTLELTLQGGTIEENTQVVLSLVGVKGTQAKSSGPSEITAAESGYMRFELHEHWHSFMGGMAGVEAENLVDVLTRLKTSPLDLWTILEYSHLLFGMFVDPATQTLTYERAALLREAVLGNSSSFTVEKWTQFCRTVGAKPRVGLSEKQFSCGVLELLNFDRGFLTAKTEGQDLKRIYVHLHSVEKLFEETNELFDDDDDNTTVHIDSLRGLQKACFQTLSWFDFIQLMRKSDADKFEWTMHDFYRVFTLQNKKLDPVKAWVQLHHSKMLFKEFAHLGVVRKQDMRALLNARKSTFDLNDEKWVKLCNDIEGDHGSPGSGITCGGFAQIYPAKAFGERDPVLDWNYVQAYRLEPEPRISKAAAMAAATEHAPAKISVNAIAQEALDKAVSTDALAKEAVDAGIAFSRTEEVVERVIELKTPAWTSSFASDFATRENGVLHVSVKSASELRCISDEIQSSRIEQFYLVGYTITGKDWENEFKRPKKKSWRRKSWEFAFGQKEMLHDCQEYEIYDDGKSQEGCGHFEQVEQTLEHCPRDNQEEYQKCRSAAVKAIEKMNPFLKDVVDLRALRVISRMVHKDPLLEGVVKFPDEKFQFYLDTTQTDDKRQTHLVFKLFKYSEKVVNLDPAKIQSRHQLTIELGRAEKAERVIRAVLEKQKQMLVETLRSEELNEDLKKQFAMFKRKEHEADELAKVKADRQERLRKLEEEQMKIDENKTKITLVGQTAVLLRDYLNVLHQDDLETDDLAMLFDEEHKVSGKLLLQLRYKCNSVNQTKDMQPLPSTDRVDYPANAPLKVSWTTSDEFGVRKGDSMTLVRENDDKKLILNTSYFTLFWNEKTDNWDIFNSSIELYSRGEIKSDILHREDTGVDDKSRKGWFLIPSSRDLGLPPGTYRLSLIRKETIDGVNYRSSVGSPSASINVYVGVNSVHTVFGTTPLVDVKTVRCSLSILDTASNSVQVSTMPAVVGTSSWWFRACGYDAEMDNALVMVRVECESLEKQLEAKGIKGSKRKRLQEQLDAARQRQERLQIVKESGVQGIKQEQEKIKTELDDLRVLWKTAQAELEVAENKEPIKQRITQIESRCRDLEDQVKGWALIRLEYERRRSVQDLTKHNANTIPTFCYDSPMRLDFVLEGSNAVSPESNPYLNDLSQDYVVVLPQVVVETADKIRVKILGKLQTSDIERTHQIRRQIQVELRVMLAVVQFANASIFGKIRTYKSMWQEMRQLKKLRWLYVFEECLPLYYKADETLKKHFPAIVADLIEELHSRTDELDLGKSVVFNNSIFRHQMPIGEYKFSTQEGTQVSGVVGAYGSLSGTVKDFIGDDPAEGDVYICKYMRRGANNGCLGELGRIGPFEIAPSTKKSSCLELSDEQKLLLVETFVHLLITAAKYFVALFNLSFNVSFVSNLIAEIAEIEWPNLDLSAIRALQADIVAALRNVIPVVKDILSIFDNIFSSLLQYIMIDMDIFKGFEGCTQGAGQLVNWCALWATALLLYIVIQEDLLAKVQNVGSYASLIANVPKNVEEHLEQLGPVLVSFVLIGIKVLILFIARQWTNFSDQVLGGTAFEREVGRCTKSGLDDFDYALQVISSTLLCTFFYFFLPLIVLDALSWVPPFDLSSDEERQLTSRGGKLKDIKDAVDNNVNLIDYGDNAKDPKWWRCCSLRTLFWFHGKGKRIFEDYKYSNFSKLLQTYGFIGIWFVIVYVYTILMLQSIMRSLAAIFGWRGKRTYMYPRAHLHPQGGTWTDSICCCFNIRWKCYWLYKKVLKPFWDVLFITVGWWSHDRWDVFDIEERAKNCFPNEPDNEVKQLQMMALHGKVNSLLWLPFSSLGILTYVSDIMNRGPILSYVLNYQFLQADRPEGDRLQRVRRRLFRWGKDQEDRPDVVYFTDTQFYVTAIKFASSVAELVSVLVLVIRPYVEDSGSNLGRPAAASLIALSVPPLMEFWRQVLISYKKFLEFKEEVQAQVQEVQEAMQGEIKAIEGSVGELATQVKEKVNEIQAATLDGIHDSSGLPSNEITEGIKSLVDDKLNEMKDNAQAKALGKVYEMENKVAGTLEKGGIHLEFDQSGLKEEPADNQEEDAQDEADKDKKGDLILLTAMPEQSYIIQSDKLEKGEGVITVNWRVNAKHRFDANDAIGMFPARSLDNLLTPRTMDQCLCYRLVSESEPQEFGWKPGAAHESHHQKVLVHRAVALERIIHTKIGSLRRKTMKLENPWEGIDGPARPENDSEGPQNKQLHIDITQAEQMFDHALANQPPSPKKVPDILLEEIEEHKEAENDEVEDEEYDEDAFEDINLNEKSAGTSAAAMSTKTVQGQVKFRPPNCNEAEDHVEHDDYVYGNSVGIYPAKFGLEKYEFLYLRYIKSKLHEEQVHSRASYVIVDNQTTQNAPESEGTVPDDYSPFSKFTSNTVSVGTFDLFIRLSSDSPLMWANQAVNVSWNIYGVSYDVLSHPNNTNCIAFYKVRDIHNARNCAKLEIVPPSAFFNNHGSGPVNGRMMVTTPKEPGMYEIRFLFNYFHKAELHRRCQVFGMLEEVMQMERIDNLLVKRSMSEALGLLYHQENRLWNSALLQAYSWCTPILDQLLPASELLSEDILEQPGKFAKAMVEEFHLKCNSLVRSENPQLQQCLESMLRPLWSTGFMQFLHDSFGHSQDLVAHTRSISFLSPTDPATEAYVRNQVEKLRHRLDPGSKNNNEVEITIRLLHDDADLVKYGPTAFEQMALDYLESPSLYKGHVDILDDLILEHTALLSTASLVLNNVSITCCAMYETAVENSVRSFYRHVKEGKKMGLFEDMEVQLKDACRSHIASLVRAAFETNICTGEKYTSWRHPHNEQSGMYVLMHRALRSWIKPRLVKGIMKNYSRRYAELSSSNTAVVKKITKICFPTPEFKRKFIENQEIPAKTGKSVVYFLHQSQKVRRAIQDKKN